MENFKKEEKSKSKETSKEKSLISKLLTTKIGRIFDYTLDLIYPERRNIDLAQFLARNINEIINIIHRRFEEEFKLVEETLPEENKKRYYSELKFKIYQKLSEIIEPIYNILLKYNQIFDQCFLENTINIICLKENMINLADEICLSLEKNYRKIENLYFLYSEADSLTFTNHFPYPGYPKRNFKKIFFMIYFLYFAFLLKLLSPNTLLFIDLDEENAYYLFLGFNLEEELREIIEKFDTVFNNTYSQCLSAYQEKQKRE